MALERGAHVHVSVADAAAARGWKRDLPQQGEATIAEGRVHGRRRAAQRESPNRVESRIRTAITRVWPTARPGLLHQGSFFIRQGEDVEAEAGARTTRRMTGVKEGPPTSQ